MEETWEFSSGKNTFFVILFSHLMKVNSQVCLKQFCVIIKKLEIISGHVMNGDFH